MGIALKDQGKLDEAIACFDLRELRVAGRPHAGQQPESTPCISIPVTMPPPFSGSSGHGTSAVPSRLPIPLSPTSTIRGPIAVCALVTFPAYFYSHAEAFFVLPLLEAHDHEKFEIHCYAGVARPDELTERHRRAADVWHDVRGISHADLAQRVCVTMELTCWSIW